jgi:hypothetical protein
MKRYTKLTALLLVVLLLTSCSPNAIALLDAVVTAAEVVIPIIGGLSPNDAVAITEYLNGALAITNSLLDAGITPEGIAAAIRSFQSLILPQLSQNVPAQDIAIINAVANAILKFIQAYQTSAPPPAASHARAALSSSDMVKIEKLKIRIASDKIKLSTIGGRLR